MPNDASAAPSAENGGEDSFKEQDTPATAAPSAKPVQAAHDTDIIQSNSAGVQHSEAPTSAPATVMLPVSNGTTGSSEICSDPLLAALNWHELDGQNYPFLESKKIFLLRRLGSGGMGAVFLGKTQRLQKEVAVKILSCGTSVDRTFTDRFKLEAQIAAQMRSPHLVEVDDADEESGVHYIVMQFVHGKTAAEWLSQEKLAGRPVSEADALAVCIAATRGLSTLHHKEVVHRDIKPGNIFIPFGNDEITLHLNESKLGDLGLARRNDAPEGLTGDCVTMGTPGYAAPEQIRSSKLAKKPADVFSMGATLYTLLAGKQPWTGDSTFEVLDATLNRPFAPLRSIRTDLSPAVIELIDTCLDKDPGKRFADGAELLTALEAVATGAKQRAVRPALRESFQPTIPAEQLGFESCKMICDENVQFTVYRPKSVTREIWTPLLAFAHLAERGPDAPPDAPDPVEEVKRQAEALLGSRASAYANLTHDSSQPVPRNGLITFVPEMEGATFDPPTRSFFWTQPTHREEFLVKASEDRAGQTLRGRLTVYCGPLLLAEVPLALKVDWPSSPRTQSSTKLESMDSSRARPFRKIFASYSHKDLPIVEACEGYAKALGDKFLRGWIDLRNAEEVNTHLKSLIEEADVFQLFWSGNAADSLFVKQEIAHALSLSRQNFVRPTYWEQPLPRPDALPPELKRLHFEKLPGIALKGELIPTEENQRPLSASTSITPAVAPSSPESTPTVLSAPSVNAPSFPAAPPASAPAPKPRFAVAPQPAAASRPPVLVPPRIEPTKPVVLPAKKSSSLSKLLLVVPMLAILCGVGILYLKISSRNDAPAMNPGDSRVATADTPKQSAPDPSPDFDSHIGGPGGSRGSIYPKMRAHARKSGTGAQDASPAAASKYEFELLADLTPGSVVLRSPALRKELHAHNLSLATGGSNISDAEKIKKLEAGEADLAVLTTQPDGLNNSSVRVVMILSESSTASAFVAHDSGPRDFLKLDGNNAFISASATRESTLARMALRAFAYPGTQPSVLETADSDEVLARFKSSQSEGSGIFVLSQLLAFQAERNRGRILLEASGSEVLAVSSDFLLNHSDDLAQLLKSYFKTLRTVEASSGHIESALCANSIATPSDAQRIAAHTLWLNAAENYARFNISPESKAVLQNYKNSSTLKALHASNFHADPSERIRTTTAPELSDAQWKSVRVMAALRDPITFPPNSAALSASQQRELKLLALVLNLFPDCYVTIRSTYRGDEILNKKRLESVKSFSRENYGIDKNRLNSEALSNDRETEGIFLFLAKPRD